MEKLWGWTSHCMLATISVELGARSAFWPNQFGLTTSTVGRLAYMPWIGLGMCVCNEPGQLIRTSGLSRFITDKPILQSFQHHCLCWIGSLTPAYQSCKDVYTTGMKWVCMWVSNSSPLLSKDFNPTTRTCSQATLLAQEVHVPSL